MTSLVNENDYQLITKLIEKLGFSLESSDKLIKKSREYLRLLQLKRGAGLVNLNDTCTIVLCVNLAAENLGCPFDKITAVKVAGVNKKSYTNFYHTVEKVLGVDKPVGVADLCVQLACPDLADLAQRLINRYVCDRTEGVVKGPPVDLTHPMYACAAVLAACKLRHVKVKRASLVELCRVRAQDLFQLAAQLTALAEHTEERRSRKRGHHLIDLVESMVKESGKTSIHTEVDAEEDDDKPKESFEEWKKRMLAKAGNT